jgi:hypothetical protein
MKTPFADELKNKYLQGAGRYAGKVEGCSEQEIEEIRLAQRVDRLPNIYRQFLAVMGREDGRLFLGTDVCYPEILEAKGAVAGLLHINGNPFPFPEDAVVFSVHQGYHITYFQTSNNEDDPAVYSYLEGDSEPDLAANHLSTFLSDEVEKRIAGIKQRKKSKGPH